MVENESVDEAIAHIVERKAPAKPKQNKWICSECTLHNEPNAIICSACSAEKTAFCEQVPGEHESREEEIPEKDGFSSIVGLSLAETGNPLAPVLLAVSHK